MTHPNLAQLSAAQANGRTTAEALLNQCLARIAAYDVSGPRLNAVVAIVPDLVEQARALDEERCHRGPRGPLHGIPFMVKDNIDVQGLPTTAGSAALRGAIAANDAEAVRRLRSAGALLLGKTNLSEFASSNGRYGYGSLAGGTRNPYHLGHHAAGSSTGSAVAVAAGFSAFALGTDSFGSVRAPASACAIFGLRPSFGRVPVDGVLPLALPFDTVGPLTRCAADLALVQAVLENRSPPPIDVAPTLHGKRIGVLHAFCDANESVLPVIDRALSALETSGATLVHKVVTPSLWHVLDNVLRPQAAIAFRAPLEAYLSALPADLAASVPRNLAALIASCEAPAISESSTPVNPRTLAQLRGALKQTASFDLSQRTALEAHQREVSEQVFALLSDVDALAFPTLLAPPGRLLESQGNASESLPEAPSAYTACYLASATGCPEVSVPAGFTPQGLPVGLSLLGAQGQDDALLELAQAFATAWPVQGAPPHAPV